MELPSDSSPFLGAATALLARTVVDGAGEVLGSVADLMLDLDRGSIAYALVATAGFLGIGERLCAVPWSALRADGQRLVLRPGCVICGNSYTGAALAPRAVDAFGGDC